jgi:hypothetical protein
MQMIQPIGIDSRVTGSIGHGISHPPYSGQLNDWLADDSPPSTSDLKSGEFY